MEKNLYIIGAGSVGGHVALNIEEYSDDYAIQGFFDDDPEKVGTEQFGFKVLGPVDQALELRQEALVIGIAFPSVKRQIVEKLSMNPSLVYPSLVHKKAWISKDVKVGQGCIIYPGTAINYGSDIKDFVVINMNCSLGHHTEVGRYSSFAPGVNTGGHSTVEEAVDVGIGVSTLQDVRVGDDSTVGGQSMIVQDVIPESTVAGVPAKVIK